MTEPILEARKVTRSYPDGRSRQVVFSDLSLTVERGQRIGLAGASGSGKSTLARCLALLDPIDAGEIRIAGQQVDGVRFAVDRATRRRVQLLWQSPRAAVDPRKRLKQVIAEPLLVDRRRTATVNDRVVALADEVGLTTDLLRRRPREVSDGQLQRACLARSLAANPDVLVADEPGSMLDASTQAALLAVLAKRGASGMAVALISHDHTLLTHWCDRVDRLEELATLRLR